MKKEICLLFSIFIFTTGVISSSCANIPSTEYVMQIINALDMDTFKETVKNHMENVENPHAVTAAQVGLGNVKDVDATNADNIVSGTVNIERLPVGNNNTTVASGADARFDTIATTAPGDTPPAGRVYVWFN